MREQLLKLAGAHGKPGRSEMTQALLAAGVATENIEVSVDKTPTGLDVDAIEAAAKTGKDCVVGQVREGQSTVVVLPVLSTGRCFAGNQR